MVVRLRFAPAPAGHLYLGGARVALLNWLYARHFNGRFILRFADLHASKSSFKYTREMMNDLEWMGLNWDEGPGVDTKHGDYLQSKRLEIYQRFGRKLLDEGLAYRCTCIPDDSFRSDGDYPSCKGKCKESQPIQSGTGTPFFIRLAVPKISFRFHDLINGSQNINAEALEDFVIFGPDEKPTQDFADAIDDALMEITHVIQTKDLFASAIRQVVIANALDLAAPVYGHVNNLYNSDGMMIKRGRRGMSVEHFREAGYLPATIVNYFGRIDRRLELRSIKRLVEEFDLAAVDKISAIVDIEQLNQLNGARIRHMKDDVFLERATPYLKRIGVDLDREPQYREPVLFLKSNIFRFSQIPRMMTLFSVQPVQLVNEKARDILRKEVSERVLWSFLRELMNLNTMSIQAFQHIMRLLQQQMGIMGRDLWGPISIALAGQYENLEVAKLSEIIGKEKCEKRIREAIELGKKLRIEKPDRSSRYMKGKKA